MRKMAYNVYYQTNEPIDYIREWLENHCKGNWKLELDGMNEDSSRINIKVNFEHESDTTKLFELSAKTDKAHEVII